MASPNFTSDFFNKECAHCSEEFNRFRSSTSHCSQCNQSLCSECLLSHQKKHTGEADRVDDHSSELTALINDKEKYIRDTSHEATEILINWYQRLINDLIECQTQTIENIQNERDRALEELSQFDRDSEQGNEAMTSSSRQIKLSNYKMTKEVFLPDSRTFQPRYKISYQFQKPSLVEEDWDIETNETTNIPLPSHLSLASPHATTPLFFSDNSQTFVTPKDDDDEEEEEEEKHTFQRREQIEPSHEINDEYLLDPKLYHLGTPRYFNSDIHLIATNGTDLLCYSHQSKQLIYINDGNINPIILQWYHGHILQLVWFDHLKSFVTLTDDLQSDIYTIESTSSFRLKIRLRTCLPPKSTSDMIKDQLFLRSDENQLLIYYERSNGRKRLRLLNSTFECTQSYAIDRCFEREEHLHSNDTGTVIGLGVNQEYIVLFVRSRMDEDDNYLAGQATTQSRGDTRLLVFSKSQMSFLRRIILTNRNFVFPFVVHFISISSYFIIDQTYHSLRFFNYEKEIGQIKLLPSNASPIPNSTTTMSTMNIDRPYSSIVLMNDGSLILSNSTQNLIQLILHDQTDDSDDW